MKKKKMYYYLPLVYNNKKKKNVLLSMYTIIKEDIKSKIFSHIFVNIEKKIILHSNILFIHKTYWLKK